MEASFEKDFAGRERDGTMGSSVMEFPALRGREKNGQSHLTKKEMYSWLKMLETVQ